MTREEALKIVRDLYEKSLFLKKDKEAIATLIPELAESDDERIRKEIIQFFKDAANSKTRVVNSNTFAEWATYLEKQKEQNPADNVSKEEYVKRFKALCDAYEIRLPNREYDIYHLCDDLSKLSIDSGKHKSVEWSKEDRHAIENCEYAIKETFKDEQNPHRIGTLDWLKSLPERFVPQSKQEWSELGEYYEDEEGDFTIYHPQKNGKGKYECVPFSFYGSLTAFSNDKDLMDFLNESFYDKEECERWCEMENEPELPECKHKVKKESELDYLCESSGDEKQKEVTPNTALEKIRKAIDNTEQLSERYKDEEENLHQYYGGKADGLKLALAYLEKQKDNKFAPRILPCSAAWFEDGEEKQKEQKPIKVYDSMDDLIADAMIDEIGKSDMPDHAKHNRTYWINKHRQKSAEWSEDDEVILKEIISFFKDGSVKLQHDLDLYAGFLEKRLKSLRPQLKHKQEEIVLHWESGHPKPYKSVLILRHGNVVVEGEWNEETGRWYQYGFQSYLEDNEVIGWMEKSLLSNTINPQPHWKPSDEQMQALQRAVRTLAETDNTADTVLLSNMYYNLKEQI